MDAVTWNGKRYVAQVSERDRAAFAGPCASFGTKRCAITQPHSSLVHLVIGLAEQAGTVEEA